MTKTKTACGCADCTIESFTRNNYFTGKLLVERDFTDEQRYYVDKLRLHQQRLHGEGVVCGLQVVPHPNPECRDRFVCIKPGFAKDCCGHDILVAREECIDITQLPAWQKLAKTVDRVPHRLQICVRYKECPTEEIPVLYDDCGCDETACAPNRILESYEFDLIVDAPLPPPRSCLPSLAGRGTLPVADVAQVVIHPASNHVYVLSGGATAHVHRLNASTHAIEATHPLPGSGKRLAVSDTGAQVYAMSFNAGSNGFVLEVLNGTTLAVISTSAAVTADGTSAIELAVLPEAAGRVASLHAKSGKLSFWNVAANPPVEAASAALNAPAKSLVLGADRTHAYAIQNNKKIAVVDVAASTVTTELSNIADPWRLVTANATGSDVLAVLDRTASTISALAVSPPQIVDTIGVDEEPVDAIASPDLETLYVITSPAGSTTFHVRAFDLARLAAGDAQPPGPALPLGQPAGIGNGAASDSVLYYPVVGPNRTPEAVLFGVSPHECPDLYAVEDCEDCDTPDCLVLATILGYRPGFRIEAKTDPPTSPTADFAAQIARIDNQLGRKVLPSTQKIAEVLDCLIECGKGGVPGPKGDPGAPGDPGADGDPGPPGPGLNFGLPKIIDIGWDPNQLVPYQQFVLRLLYKTNPITEIRDKFQAGERPLPWLTIFFNEKMKGISRDTFSVEIEYPQMLRPGFFSGIYNLIRLKLYGFIMDLGPVASTPHTLEPAASAWTFIPYVEFFYTPLIQPALWQLLASYAPPADFPEQTLDLPSVRVRLAGDFVFSPDLNGNYDEQRLLDGDNIGGQVGINRTRGGLITGSKNPSGDMVLGGDFQGWFRLGPPENINQPINSVGLKSALDAGMFGEAKPIAINTASAEDLRMLPGMDEATAKRVLAERRRAKFRTPADLRERLRVSEDVAALLGRIVEF